jgi:hypothetical protein
MTNWCPVAGKPNPAGFARQWGGAVKVVVDINYSVMDTQY